MSVMRIPEAVAAFERDLRGIFGSRLQSIVVYGMRAQHAGSHADGHGDAHHQHESAVTHTLVVVDALSSDDLRACTARIPSWHEAALATPLLLAEHEFDRALDAFPFEFGAILADYVVVSGQNPFDGLTVDPADLRRACEVQARGHLLHLRQGYLEARGDGNALSVLIVRSAPAFAALVSNLVRLEQKETADVASAARHLERQLNLPSTIASDVVALAGVKEISAADAERLFQPYLDGVERLVTYIDQWRP